MKKNRSFTAVIFGLAMILSAGIARAQSEASKMEVGVQFSALKSGTAAWYDDSSGLGGGLRFTYNLNKFLALEGEMNYFPGSGYYDVRRLQGQYGVKTGVRFNQVGFFGKLRPGFMRMAYDIPIICVAAPCNPLRQRQTSFSMDVGGVVEFYPAKHLTVRFDVGDAIVHREISSASLAAFALPSLSLFIPPKETTHHLQISAGFGYRF